MCQKTRTAGLGGVLSVLAILSAAAPSFAYAPDVFEVCGLNPKGDNFLALREGPGPSYRMLLKLEPRTVVVDWDRKGDWYLVTDAEATRFEGWVYAKYLCLIEDH